MECFNAHMKIIILCMLCTLVYLYLYASISIQTLRIQGAIDDTVTDFEFWKIEIRKFASRLTNDFDNEETSNKPGERVGVTEVTKISKKANSVKKKSVLKPRNEDMLRLYYPKQKVEEVKKFVTEHDIRLPLITLFTTWVTRADKFLCHNNTLHNWNMFKPYVHPVLFMNEVNVTKEAKQKGWSVLPIRVTGTKHNVPVLRYMYEDAKKYVNSTFYAYVNGDILFTDTLLYTLISVLASDIPKEKPLLIVGQRTNIKDVKREEAKSWKDLANTAKTRGKLFSTWGVDYFITSRDYPWSSQPDVVIGRVAYDNWVVWNSKRLGFVTIDATKTLLAVHQTTRAGNMEGHGHPDGGYNANLLRKVYKKIQYNNGLTSSTQYCSGFDKYGNITFRKKF